MNADVGLRPASTVVVLRESPRGPELFMVRRHHTVAFMAGADVFPGGRVDPEDAHATPAWCDLPAGPAQARGPLRAFYTAAARELFEEAGLLLARDASGECVAIDDSDSDRFAQYRVDVHQGRRTLESVVETESLRLALDLLVPFAHWVTPPIESRRFDTWFFIARMPERQPLSHETTESSDGLWLTPGDALARAARGVINLPPPTWTTLREIERFTSVDAALGWAAARRIVMRQPVLIEERGRRVIEVPLAHDSDIAFNERRFLWSDGRWLPERTHD